MMNVEKPIVVYVDCPQCHERIKLELNDIVFQSDYVKLVHTHGKFGVKPHSIIIDINREYIPKQVTIADRTFTKIG